MSIPKHTKKPAPAFLRMGLVLLLLGAVCALYLTDYYRADEAALESFAIADAPGMQKSENGNLCWIPENPRAGLIFYPGGKVDHRAYIPLMETLAAEDILCVLVEMPFRLAIFDVAAAEEIPEQYPQVPDWYIGGHSLGGSAAAMHLADTDDVYSGLLLLGSYATENLTDRNLSVLSLVGSEDWVLNREKYESCKANLPGAFTQITIEGGCHAGFGMYGPQDGDGIPTLSPQDQIRISAEAIADWVSIP